ncbi:MAG: TonB-dependent receptor [Candidatus Eremiobacteraeota bacterium]|nr:TonB-dependent receptor [Candidatus Eremiobacteraeota bacterium]
MAIPHSVRRGIVAVLLLIAFVLQGTTSVLAGTTGAITGTVVDPASNQPVSGAKVTAASPSQTATATSDATGRFSFISLNPDTYTVSTPATSAREAASISGVTVQADQTINVSLTQPQKLKVIGAVTSRAAAALVKPGTTADVYSINAVTQDKASAVGGGGNLNTAWSAITTVPGVFISPNQTGYIGAGATISIRGGDYDQIGYELDGIPVNRAFDNYPSGPLSSLGQQELQVYTGATPANSEAEGISGYINQVIRTGTAPASRNLTLAIGTPIFYNKIAFEAGGANPARTFSYYLGAGAYNQDFRYYDQYNGASLQQNWGSPLGACDGVTHFPGCFGPNGQDYTNGGKTPAYALGPYNVAPGGVCCGVTGLQDRDTVANFHFGIPRKDGNRDDVQVLLDINFINNPAYTSTNDQGGAAFLDAIGAAHTYVDGYNFTGQPVGTLLPANYAGGGVTPYLFPQSPGGRPFGVNIEPDRRDAFVNNQGIFKAQYQRNFGTNAFLRVYGYTYYSDWLQTGPQSTQMNYLGYVPSDYELHAHTRGVSAQFSDQLNAQHLLSIQGSYTTSSTLRDNNSGIGKTGAVGWLVSSAAPLSGICYTAAGVATNCISHNNGAPATFSLKQGYNGTVVPADTLGVGGLCGAGACQYLLAENGVAATYNTVTPKFGSFSITDQWKPTDRLNLNLGLRYDSFVFNGSDTTASPARAMWYNAWNLANPTNILVNPGAGQVESYSELQPRLGMTYTVNPSTVLRASYGRYAQAPNSAFEQYNFLQQNSTASLARFGKFGLPTTPGHPVRPEVSNNYDLSYEHSFGRDTSVKFTPFLRKTQDQIQQFFLDQKTNFVSGLNVGRQTSEGVELEVDKGDFSRNGLAGRLSFTYTNSYINYTRLGNGGTIIDGFNTNIAAYNALTKAGGGSPCYTAAGAADPACAAGSIANPYYNAPIQPLMDVNANYPTFDTFPGGIGAGGYESFGAPFVSTLVVQYKHGPLAITPALQFFGGQRYGVPLSTPGIDPTAGCGALPGTTANDPRYRYGAAGGAPYDATTCGGQIAIPDPYTGRFDGVGGFVAPNSILLHTQVTYDVNKRVTLVANFANIINRCWGGTAVGFTVNRACQYTATYGAGAGPQPIGNQFNPGWAIQPFLRAPYDPQFPSYPFNMFFEARIKI